MSNRTGWVPPAGGPGRGVSDDLLLADAAAGCERAFNVVAARHRPFIFRAACKVLRGDGAAAQDVAQHTLMDLHRAVPGYQGRGRLRGLLYTMMINRVRMMTRRKRVELVDARVLEGLAVDWHGPEEDLLRRERLDELARAVMELSTCVRVVLLMRYGSGRTQGEIARVLRIPVGTVKSRLAAGLAELRTRAALRG